MVAVKIKADGTIVLPKEARRTLDPKKRYEAISMGDRVMIAPATDMSLKEIFARTNDGTPAPSEDEIQAIIDEDRKRRRNVGNTRRTSKEVV